MEKLIKIAEDQIENLVKVQIKIDDSNIEEKVKISVEIRKWSEFIYEKL